MTATADFTITDHGSIIGFRPNSEAARQWFDDHLETEGWQWMGDFLYMEHRVAQRIVNAIEDEGFSYEDS